MEHTRLTRQEGDRPKPGTLPGRGKPQKNTGRKPGKEHTPMKKYIAVITEDDIRSGFEEAVAQLEEDGAILFPDTESRAEFIEDCVNCEIDRFELYDSDPFRHRPDYAVAVLDMADLYEYTL